MSCASSGASAEDAPGGAGPAVAATASLTDCGWPTAAVIAVVLSDRSDPHATTRVVCSKR
jgi:hypothetical protein